MIAAPASTTARHGVRLAVLLALAVLGCGGKEPAPTAPISVSDVSHLYWALTIDHRGVTLSTAAPYDTITLVATLCDATGAPLAAQAPVTFRTDNSKIALTPDGHVRALGVVTAARVIAEAAIGNIRHADTALITVTADDPPPVLAYFDVQADSTVPMLATLPFVARAFTADSVPIPATALNVAYTVSDPLVASITNGRLLGHKIGHVSVIATTTVYGVTMADTLDIDVTMRLGAVVNVIMRATKVGEAEHPVFSPSEVVIAPGGYVVWFDKVAKTDIVFDDPTNVVAQTALPGTPTGTGNVAPFGGDTFILNNFQSRAFTQPGVYEYHSTLIPGATGRVVVSADIPQ